MTDPFYEELKKKSKEELLEMLSEYDKHLKAPKLLVKTFNTNEVKLLPMGDWHVGSKYNKEKLKGNLKYAQDNDAQILGMGDYIDCITRNSKGDIFEAEMTPQEQFEVVLDYFEPIKKNVWGLLEGNHEYRVRRDTSFDITKLLCKTLNIPYLGYANFIKLKVKDQNYSIYATHGNSGASTIGGKVNAIKRLGDIGEADVYLMGHVHELLCLSDEIRKINNKNKMLVTKKRYFVITGGYQDYEGTYAQRMGYKPGKQGTAKIKFYGKNWDIHVSE